MSKLYPFYINTKHVASLTTEQMHEARYRCARDFGARVGFSSFVYIMILASITIVTDSGRFYFKEHWLLVIMVYVFNIGRILIARKLALAEKNHYRSYLNSYYALTLGTALFWGIIMSMMLWTDQLQNFSYLLLSITIALTGGANGTLTSYVRTNMQYNFFIWLPIVSALVFMSYTNVPSATLLLYLITIMLFFVISQARRIAFENQTGILHQIQLESRSNELALALQTIQKQQEEVKKHRDHLQELVDEKTIDLIEAKEKAEQADKSKSEFLANMSHELRTPLHSILSFSHFGLERLGEVNNDKIRDYFEKINYSGEIQLSLVNDLLDLSRMEFKKEALFLQHHNLSELVENVIEELSVLYEEKMISITFDKPTVIATINADENKIKQLLRNLLGNAIKFSPENAPIFIRIFNSGNSIRLEIEDRGPGVPDKDKKPIFDKFIQSSRTRTGAGGTGLGLAICAQIMLLHKGDLWVEDIINSDAESGALFVVIFPSLHA